MGWPSPFPFLYFEKEKKKVYKILALTNSKRFKMWRDIPQGGMNFNLKTRELRQRVALEEARGTACSKPWGWEPPAARCHQTRGGWEAGGRGARTLGVGAAEPSPGSRPGAYPCVLEEEGLRSSPPPPERTEPAELGGSQRMGAEAGETQKEECFPAPGSFSHRVRCSLRRKWIP